MPVPLRRGFRRLWSLVARSRVLAKAREADHDPKEENARTIYRSMPTNLWLMPIVLFQIFLPKLAKNAIVGCRYTVLSFQVFRKAVLPDAMIRPHR